ncbi:Lrp/AsnC family transcriptional regulator [Streptomyces zagrosensis]|uniref:DNA-binding Lrp family transcriptional regulator n=1 Tax=Streptomyces zagrosensis TaxID=1042984 RepID=A0A7W9QEQ8_9ACTN|nr:Lrp/AsnC family transcriptional regulator [Streptomyces zagrosensis]MBB5938781.1 DNA-binding Lrp family transcriptional regulator [Streptomyces zagrosensis]
MDSSALGEADQHLLHLLQLDGRAPFSHLAHCLEVSERTVARRYQRLRTLGLRIVGQPVPARLGLTRWLVRLHCTPDAAGTIAKALARRSDTSWVTLASGGTELYCAVTTRTADERDALLLHKLPRTPHVLSVGAHCMMRIFAGATSTWHGSRLLPATSAGAVDSGARTPPLKLDATDRTLFTELAADGRATLPELGAATGRSPSSVQRHLERLRGEGALCFAVDFDPVLLGYHMSTRLWMRVAPAHLRTVGETLATHPEIPFAAAVTGTSNLVASGVFRDAHELYDYLDQRIGPLPGIQSIETAPVLREIKRLAPTIP